MHQPTPLPLEAQRYLEQLDLEAAMLPQPRRAQLVSQIREHLHDAVEDRAEIGAVLDRLGTPRELVAEAQPEAVTRSAPESRSPWMRVLAIAALTVGAMLLLVSVALLAMTGRGRSILFAIPGLVAAGTGVVLLLQDRRARLGARGAASSGGAAA